MAAVTKAKKSDTGIHIQMPSRPKKCGNISSPGSRYSNWRVSDRKILIFAFPMLWKKLPMTICAPTSGNMATAMRTPLEAISISSSSLVKMADMV